VAVDRRHVTFPILIPSRPAFLAAGFFLARSEGNGSKLKIAVGTVVAGGPKCFEFRTAGRARSNPTLIRCPVFRFDGRARGYPNLIWGGNGLARLMFSGHVDDHANKINSPAMYALPNLYRMPFRGIEDVEIFPLLESPRKRERGNLDIGAA
jgi:hypothetical protein